MEYLKQLTQDYFEKGMEVSEYLKKLRNYRSVVKGLMDEAKAGEEYVQRLSAAKAKASAGKDGPVRATVMTEDWCGDSACNIPVLSDLFNRSEIPLRILRGSEHQRLRERYKRDGDSHIPVVSIWDGEGNELARWIEAPAKVDEMKNEWKAENPELMELYGKQKEDKEAAKKFASLYRSFLLTMADWYKDGMWSETTREIVEKAEEAAGEAG